MSLAPSMNLTFQKFHCTVARGFSPQHRSPSSLLQESIDSVPSVGWLAHIWRRKLFPMPDCTISVKSWNSFKDTSIESTGVQRRSVPGVSRLRLDRSSIIWSPWTVNKTRCCQELYSKARLLSGNGTERARSMIRTNNSHALLAARLEIFGAFSRPVRPA